MPEPGIHLVSIHSEVEFFIHNITIKGLLQLDIKVSDVAAPGFPGMRRKPMLIFHECCREINQALQRHPCRSRNNRDVPAPKAANARPCYFQAKP